MTVTTRHGKKPRILLVIPPLKDPWEARTFQPLGIAYVAASLRKADVGTVEILDCQLGDQDEVDVVNKAVRGQYEVLGISVCTATFPSSARIAKAVKARLPSTIIIFGGPHCTAEPESTLERVPEVDMVVRNEGEITAVEAIRALINNRSLRHVKGISYRMGSEIRSNPQRELIDVDKHPFPARDLLPHPSHYGSVSDGFPHGRWLLKATFLSARGCPFNCTFCSMNSLYAGCPGKKWRPRSIMSVLNEVGDLMRLWNVEYIHFLDSDFLILRHRALEIALGLKEMGVRFQFCTTPRNLLKNRYLLSQFKQAGCRLIELGIESGHPAVLRRLTHKTTVEINHQALELVRTMGFKLNIGFIMFDPWTTPEELDVSLQFIESHKLYLLPSDAVYRKLMLFPGTQALRAFREAGGYLNNEYSPMDYEFFNPTTERIYNQLIAFRDKYQKRLDKIIEKAGLMCLPNDGEKLVPRYVIARARWLMIQARKLPFLYLRRVLDEAISGTQQLSAICTNVDVLERECDYLYRLRQTNQLLTRHSISK